jgi:antitoxin ParD1/3/4
MAIFAKLTRSGARNKGVKPMSTMNVSLPDDMRLFVEERVAGGTYGTASEYVRELIRRDQERLNLRQLLLAGATSADAGPADASYFAALRQRVAAPKTRARRRA